MVWVRVERQVQKVIDDATALRNTGHHPSRRTRERRIATRQDTVSSSISSADDEAGTISNTSTTNNNNGVDNHCNNNKDGDNEYDQVVPVDTSNLGRGSQLETYNDENELESSDSEAEAGVKQVRLERVIQLIDEDAEQFKVEYYIHHAELFHICKELGGKYSFQQLLAQDPSRIVFMVPQGYAQDMEQARIRLQRYKYHRNELNGRLSAIEERNQQLQYARMVSDVAPSFAAQLEHGGNDPANISAGKFVSSVRNQFSMGGNVIATMVTCFACGYFLARSYFGEGNHQAPLIGGAIGLTLGLLFDIMIIIGRLYLIDKSTSKPSETQSDDRQRLKKKTS